MPKIRVLVVDDSFFMRKVIVDILQSDPEIEVIAEVSNGREALEKIEQLRPDVVTLDYEMPHMDGLQTLQKIMDKDYRPAVIVVSGYVKEGADVTLRFLESGALDFVLKPSGSLSLDMNKVKEQLIQKVKIAAKVDVEKLKNLYKKKSIPHSIAFRADHQGVVVIGSSTGGPAALEVLLPQFPKDFPLPVLVAQHLPRPFIASFVERLSQACQLQVVTAEDGMSVSSGKIIMAPGGADTEVIHDADNVGLRLTDNLTELESPSVNKLMNSAAQVYRSATIGIILTGMGKDGTLGMQAIKEQGGKTLVQDENTSVVYGMGREVVEKGLADDIVPLDRILEKLSELLN